MQALSTPLQTAEAPVAVATGITLILVVALASFDLRRRRRRRRQAALEREKQLGVESRTAGLGEDRSPHVHNKQGPPEGEGLQSPEETSPGQGSLSGSSSPSSRALRARVHRSVVRRAQDTAQEAAEAELAGVAEAERLTITQKRAQEKAEANTRLEAEARWRREAKAAVERLRAAEAAHDELAVEEEIARGQLPAGVATQAEQRLNDQRLCSKAFTKAREECAAEVDAAFNELRKARLELSHFELSAKEERERALEEVAELRQDLEMLVFEQDLIASQAKADWMTTGSASAVESPQRATDSQQQRLDDEKRRWQNHTDRTLALMKRKEEQLRGYEREWGADLQREQVALADLRSSSNAIEAELYAERTRWQRWSSDELDRLRVKLSGAQQQRVDQARLEWDMKLQQARAEVQRAMEAKRTNRESWDAATEASQDEIALLELLLLELASKVAEHRKAFLVPHADGKAEIASVCGAVMALERTCPHELSTQGALRHQAHQITEKQRVGAYQSSSASRALPRPMALPAPSSSASSSFSGGRTCRDNPETPAKAPSAHDESSTATGVLSSFSPTPQSAAGPTRKSPDICLKVGGHPWTSSAIDPQRAFDGERVGSLPRPSSLPPPRRSPGCSASMAKPSKSLPATADRDTAIVASIAQPPPSNLLAQTAQEPSSLQPSFVAAELPPGVKTSARRPLPAQSQSPCAEQNVPAKRPARSAPQSSAALLRPPSKPQPTKLRPLQRWSRRSTSQPTEPGTLATPGLLVRESQNDSLPKRTSKPLDVGGVGGLAGVWKASSSPPKEAGEAEPKPLDVGAVGGLTGVWKASASPPPKEQETDVVL